MSLDLNGNITGFSPQALSKKNGGHVTRAFDPPSESWG